MSLFPRTAPPAPGPANGLRTHAGTLRHHADRLRAATAKLAWHGSQADAVRARVAELAARCETAASGLALAAAQLDDHDHHRGRRRG